MFKDFECRFNVFECAFKVFECKFRDFEHRIKTAVKTIFLRNAPKFLYKGVRNSSQWICELLIFCVCQGKH